MQSLNSDILNIARKEKMHRLEQELSSYFLGASNREMILCPFCKYVGKNKRPTARLFENNPGKTFKCFACGIWRRLE